MDFNTALISAIGGLVTTVVFLVGVIRYLWKRGDRRQLSNEKKLESLRQAMEERLESSEENCRSELKIAMVSIGKLQEDVNGLLRTAADRSIQAILLYIEKRDKDRELLEDIATALGVSLPAEDPSRRTTVQIRAIK